MVVERITLISARIPEYADINSELQWLAASLGMFGQRDKDSSCFRIFVTLLETAKKNTPLTSDRIATQCDLSRGTVIHHINKLRDAGLVRHEIEGYSLSAGNLEESVMRLENEVQEMLKMMRLVARDIDKKFLRE